MASAPNLKPGNLSISPVKALLHKRLEELNWGPADLARAYERLKYGESAAPEPDTTTVSRVLAAPENCEFEAVQLCLSAMGVTLQAVSKKTDL